VTSFTTSSTKNTIHEPINRKKKGNYEDTRDDGFTLQSEGGTPTLFQHRPKDSPATGDSKRIDLAG
jgi:hypothetical protein